MTDPHELHAEALVVDFHTDLPSRLIEDDDEPDASAPRPEGQVDLPRLRAGGVDAVVMALFTADGRGEDPVRRTLRMIDAVHLQVERHPEAFRLCETAADVREAAADGVVGLLLSIENGIALGGRLAMLRAYRRLGVRAVGLVWNGRNELADGCGETRSGGRLTTFGVEVVREMGRLGMIVDVSHLSEPGFWEVLEVAEGPVIASHSNARALCDHPRNLTDDQIRALASAGGVVGMNFYPTFLRDDGEEATSADVVRHVDHLVDLVGPAHVGLGSDYDGIPEGPADLPDASSFPVLTRALLDAGHGPDDLRAILGESWLRVLGEAAS